MKITEGQWTTQKVERNASAGTWTDHTNTFSTPRGNTHTLTIPGLNNIRLHNLSGVINNTYKPTHGQKKNCFETTLKCSCFIISQHKSWALFRDGLSAFPSRNATRLQSVKVCVFKLTLCWVTVLHSWL